MKYLLAIAFAVVASAAVAQTMDHGDIAMSTGTITKIDTEWNELTIDHGPLENLEMDAMTMVFEVADPAMFEGFSEGQETSSRPNASRESRPSPRSWSNDTRGTAARAVPYPDAERAGPIRRA